MAVSARQARRIQTPYRAEFVTCQYTEALREFGAELVPWVWAHMSHVAKRYRRLPAATELDHIYGKRGPCEDSVNYMMTCRVAHHWKTNNTTLGRIVAVWAKIQLERSGESELTHFDPVAVRAIWGRHALGQLQVWRETVDLPEWADLMAADAIERWDAQPTDGVSDA